MRQLITFTSVLALPEIFTDTLLIGYYEYKQDMVRADHIKAFPVLNMSFCVQFLSRDDLHVNSKVLGPVIKNFNSHFNSIANDNIFLFGSSS